MKKLLMILAMTIAVAPAWGMDSEFNTEADSCQMLEYICTVHGYAHNSGQPSTYWGTSYVSESEARSMAQMSCMASATACSSASCFTQCAY